MTLSCFDLGERMLSVAEAQRHLAGLVGEPLAIEACPLAELSGRVLAEAVHSPIDVPQNTNAAMDGIALAWPQPVAALALVGRVLAGGRLDRPLAAGEAVTITTGAPLPEGADTVIMQEQLAFPGAGQVQVSRPETVRRGQHVRRAGEDVARGSQALAAGTRLGAAQLGLLASLGLTGARVHRRPRVAIFSSGDEVTAPGAPLPAAGIYDANRYSLRGLLQALGCQVIDLGILPDDRETVVGALRQAAQDADMVITSGGVSVGQADWIKAALAEVGELGFWRIAMRPGRPLACGWLGEGRTPFFGLPGNPVAVMVTFLQFVQPVLRRLMGQPEWQPRRLTALAAEPLVSRVGRVDYLRGTYHSDREGRLWVRPTGRQGSGILTSMVLADCLIEVDAERQGVAEGEPVTLQLLNDFS
ncbi:molybdopterin molybdotransferase MoeA [Halomonas sp. 328]|uniref:molybdopterin molybdotransferase MoeA n=1 Tax=Halomonas sp. 328 TaxID=2776704 RepID=UPI0018A77E77|nr:gephyrin-like molybdotransferase Glp [Halomonas sp. 328]MBF8224242.1 molybdopterin molybdenumtransferase MoeA [Halomonas sp. 328]